MLKVLLKKIISVKTREFIRRQYYKILSTAYKGDNYYCICCDRSFKSFLEHGNIPRKNAKCPYCRSLERTRLLNHYLLNETDVFFGEKKLLHFAPEYQLGENLRKALKTNYLSVDIRKGVADEVQDIQDLSFSDNTFEYIICSCVLGHIPNEAKAIDEMFRVLKPNGKAFIITLINFQSNKTYQNDSIKTPEDKLKHYTEDDLCRLHGKDFIERLNRSNVHVKEIEYSSAFSTSEKLKFSLGNTERELIYLVTKN